MEVARQRAIQALKDAREELLSIKKDELTYPSIETWWTKWFSYFLRAENLVDSGPIIRGKYGRYVSGYEQETDVDILDEQRTGIVSILDAALPFLDREYTVRPVLEDLILRVKDTKLAELLKEFNAVKDTSPNLAAMGFRTVLTLIIREKAKIVNPTSHLATRDDLALDACINSAIQDHIFSSGEEKLLKRYRDSGSKDKFDNIVHKPGANNLMQRDDLSDAVTNLLNSLLSSIIQ